MGRTDAILNAVKCEVNKRRQEIDGDCDLRALTIVVRLSEKTGLPHRVLYRPESECDLTPR